jgi:hypothetical protein
MFMAQVTKKDIKEAVNTQVEKEFLASAEKRVKAKQKEYYTKPDEVIDLCPYCNETRTFPNDKKEIIEIDGEPHLVLICPECHNKVYAHFRLIEDGDMFSGYGYECIVTMKKADKSIPTRIKKPLYGFTLKRNSQ